MEFVECKICGFRSLSHLQSHLIWKHGTTPKNYMKKFPGNQWHTKEWKHKMDAARRRNANTPAALKAKSKIGKKNRGQKRSEEWKNERSEKYSGAGNPFYGHTHSLTTKIKLSCYFQGISEEEFENFTKPENIRLTKSGAFKAWRKIVFARDDYTCMLCDKRGGDLEPHHIIPRRDSKELIYEVSNGATLCKTCHKKTFGKEYEFVDVLNSRVRGRIIPFQL
jgi:hypothetical protein